MYVMNIAYDERRGRCVMDVSLRRTLNGQSVFIDDLLTDEALVVKTEVNCASPPPVVHETGMRLPDQAHTFHINSDNDKQALPSTTIELMCVFGGRAPEPFTVERYPLCTVSEWAQIQTLYAAVDRLCVAGQSRTTIQLYRRRDV
jgi:hypothetical protein